MARKHFLLMIIPLLLVLFGCDNSGESLFSSTFITSEDSIYVTEPSSEEEISSFEDYKQVAKTIIDVYAEERVTFYNDEGWSLVTTSVNNGKTLIDAAETESEVEVIVANVKKEIDDVEPKWYAEIRGELEGSIKNDYYQKYHQDLDYHHKGKSKIYGIHNGAPVFFISIPWDACKCSVIAGVKFEFIQQWHLRVWKEGIFYDLETELEVIFNERILTQTDIEYIGYIHNKTNYRYQSPDCCE